MNAQDEYRDRIREAAAGRALDAQEIRIAKARIRRAVMAKFGGELPIASIEVSDEDAVRYIKGASIDELLA